MPKLIAEYNVYKIAGYGKERVIRNFFRQCQDNMHNPSRATMTHRGCGIVSTPDYYNDYGIAFITNKNGFKITCNGKVIYKGDDRYSFSAKKAYSLLEI